jgi:uncharacterized protein
VIINLYDLPAEGRQLTGKESGIELDSDRGAVVHCTTPVSYDLFAQVVTETLLVSGSLRLKAEVQCVKCAELFEVEVVESNYTFDAEVDEKSEQVDLTEDIREAIILAFPSYPVCRDGCKGLCPQCGADRNRGECDCSAPEDPRWGALGSL